MPVCFIWGTASVLARHGVAAACVRKRSEGSPNAVDLIEAGGVDLVINTPFGRGPRTDGSVIRTAAIRAGIPCVTTLPGVLAAVQGIEALRAGAPPVLSLQEYHSAPRRDAARRPASNQEGTPASMEVGR